MVWCATVVARRDMSRTSALKRTKHIAQSVGVGETLRRLAGSLYLLRNPNHSLGIEAEGAGVGAGTEGRRRSLRVKGGSHQWYPHKIPIEKIP